MKTKTYERKIAFCMPAFQMKTAGGIGQFAKGFCEMAARLNWKVDVILDKAPRSGGAAEFVATLEAAGATICQPESPIHPGPYNQWFTFSQSYSLECITSIRNTLIEQMQKTHYDAILHNMPEFILATHSLALRVPIINYSHHPDMVFLEYSSNDIFLKEYFEMYFKMASIDNQICATQTQRNADELTEKGLKSLALTMPCPEQGLMEPYSGSKEGVLFIGRWEERKFPTAFVELIKVTGLPARVMTSPKGVAKFERELDAIGATHDVRSNIMGQEKIDFIRSSKVFYMPSKKESFGFALMENMGHSPCVVLSDNHHWYTNFDTQYIDIVTQADAAERVTELYKGNHDRSEALKYVNEVNDMADSSWESMFEHPLFDTPTFKQGSAALSKLDNFYLDEYVDTLGRRFAYDDMNILWKSIDKWTLTQTDTTTWFSSDNTPPRERTSNPSDSLFGC